MLSRLKVLHKGLILVGLPLVLEISLIAALSFLLHQSEEERTKEIRYRRGAVVSAHLVALTAEVPLLVLGALEYNSDRLFSSYKKNVALIKKYTREIDQIRQDCPEVNVPFKEDLQKQQSRILAVTAKFAEMRSRLGLGDRVSKLMQMYREVREASSETTDDLQQLTLHGESETAKTREKQVLIRRQQSLILLAGAVANLLLGVVLAIFYRKNILQRILTITKNTVALSMGQPMSAPLKGSDEIALVDQSFHAMHEQLIATADRERALFENAIDVICVLNEAGQIASINPICRTHWGYSPEELQGISILTLVAPSFLVKVEDCIARARSVSEAVIIECNIKTKDGQEKEMLWSVYWSESEQCLYCTAHDLTEEKQLERTRRQFVEMISSNLQAPLSSIEKALKRLVDPQESKLSGLALEKLSQANKNLRRLVNLVNDLLQINQLESVQMELRKEYCEVAEIVERSIENVQTLAQEKDIQFELKIAAGKWEVDGDRIIQVLVNLLSNAIKFSPEHSTICLAAANEKGLVKCSVTDQGRGVPDSMRRAIFEKFKQVRSADGKRKSGTGLGLPICRQIIEQHGGEISIDSVEGRGSIFWFTVPGIESASPPGIGDAAVAVNAVGREVTEAAVAADAKVKAGVPARPIEPRMGLAAKGFLLVGIPFICEILLVGLMAGVLLQVDHERAFELKERLTSNYANAVVIACIDAQIRMGRPYSDEEWQHIRQDMDAAHNNRDRLNKLIKGDRQEMSYAIKAEQSFPAIDSAFEIAQNAVKEGRLVFLSFPERHATLQPLLRLLHNMNKVIEIAELKEFESPSKQQELRQRQANILVLGLSASIISAFFLAVYFSRDINSRLMLLADNAGRLARNRELNPVQRGFDEIARLDQIFHVMAAALNEARKKERAIFDNSSDIICVIDSNGRFLSMNPACLKSWGYSVEALIDDKNVLDITCEDDREITKKTLLDASTAPLRFRFENRILRQPEGIAHTLWSCSRKPGEPLLYCIAHDQSAKRELEQLKQEFLEMVSHDLRSPLTGIVGMTQLTAAGSFGEVCPSDLSLLQQINHDGRSLVEMTSDLLDLEKLEAGKMRLVMEEVELADVIKKAIEACPDQSRIKLVYTLELDETVVAADSERLAQALTGIIKFALIESKDTVKVRLSNQEKQSHLQIIDSAEALSTDECRRLFNHYGNAAAAQEPEKVSVYLALALAKSIVEGHQGTISVSPGPDGNVFDLQLPLDSDELSM